MAASGAASAAKRQRVEETSLDVLGALPARLRQRSRLLPGCHVSTLGQTGSCVLYWAQSALRGDENPALDSAAAIANAIAAAGQAQRVVVVQLLLPQQPYASDRFAWFELECAIDLKPAIERAGASFACVAHTSR